MIKNNKFIVITLIILSIVGGMFIYVRGADGFDNNEYIEETEAYKREMDEFRREELANDYENGRVTEEERDMWLDHYDDMNRYDESGYSYGRGCHGRGSRNNMHMNGNRNSMMGGYRY